MNYIRACEEIQNLLEMRGVHCEYTKHAFSGEKWDMLSLIYMGIGKNIFSLELKNLGDDRNCFEKEFIFSINFHVKLINAPQ